MAFNYIDQHLGSFSKREVFKDVFSDTKLYVLEHFSVLYIVFIRCSFSRYRYVVSTKMCVVVESFVKMDAVKVVLYESTGRELIFFPVLCLFSCPTLVKV
jgi:hypothetical protein